MSFRARWIVPFVLLAGAGCETAPLDTPAQGQHLFTNYCAPCHQEDASGSQDIGAPALAGLPQWYIQDEVGKYRTGLRGAHRDDAEGLRMRAMSRTLREDSDIEAVATWLSTQHVPRAEATIAGGDAAAGSKLFTTCSACHGADAAGNEQLHAPPLTVQQDWYIARQLGKFKAGIRGVNPKDLYGNQMRPMAAMLADDKAVNDVLAHIETLGR